MGDAEALSVGTFPIDLFALVGRLGIGIVGEGRASGPHLGRLEHRGGNWTIVLPGQARSEPILLGPRERFTVAHEIGHYLVEARFGYRPTGTREYWKLETLCNEFASSLLLPIAALQAKVRRPMVSARELVDFTAQVAREGKVSLEASARRIVALSPIPAVVVAILPPDRTSPFGSVGWTAQNREWFRGGRGRKLGPEDLLSGVASNGADLPAGASRQVTVDGASDAMVNRRHDVILFSALFADAPAVVPG
ncbi:MAG: ImmA/IrrE family metallo-endopeptidase [Chloroflexi bacterium]|nr:ImmA/IrrE family metallo-endopeptidase [Chloroflexota bacterium]